MTVKKLKTLLCDLPDDAEVEVSVKAVDIEWDTDGGDMRALCLSTEMEIPLDVAISNNEIDENAIGDYISDESGFCHYGFGISVATTTII